MVRYLFVLVLAGSTLLAAGPPTDAPPKQPITTDTSEVGRLLQKWWKEGTAAGNADDWYDNRDGEHSPLDLSPWPQLRKVRYSEADFKARRNWALQPRVVPHVVFGNSSTSAPPELSGSNPRTYYCSALGLALLQSHYFQNNLYIYPEHRDHDPGHNGVGDGYGDLYPTNTPFLVISQGSSGSDQPFMRAMPFLLAAFRPEVKKKLVETGLLMPTVQMIFRSTNKQLKKPADYFTGKAHPTVFDGSWVDPLAMVRKAHAIRADDIPPVVRLAVVSEDVGVNGKDFFESPRLTEKLADTSTVIARVYRSSAGKRRMVVKASDSLDVNKKPLTFHWVVLRGDPKHVAVTPRDKAGAEAEVVIDYHARAPIAPGSAMESNRVDIGVFANNGVHDSAPAFITSFTLDTEARVYDAKGRIAEIAYGAGFVEPVTSDVAKLLAVLGKGGPAAKVLGLDADACADLAKAAKAAGILETKRDDLRKKRQAAEKARAAAKGSKERQAKWEEVNREVVKSEADLAKALAVPSSVARAALDRAMKSPTLWRDHAELTKLAKDDPGVAAVRKKLERLGYDGRGSTPFEKALRDELNAAALAAVLQGLVRPVFHTNFVDARLVTPKRWREVYRYDGDTPEGWTRYTPEGKKTEFTAEGWLVVERDDKGRPSEARPVEYRQAAPPPGPRWGNPNPLEAIPTKGRFAITYEGNKRRVEKRE